MDFDSIIPILLVLLFFVFPSLLKRFNKKKKTAGPARAGEAKKLSLFEKLGEQIREYAQTLEQEAQKGRQPRENIWDQLADDEEFPSPHEGSFEQDFEPDVYADEPVVEPIVSAAAPMSPDKKVRQSMPTAGNNVSACDPSSSNIFRPRKLSSRRLQQAVIWSEILSKPVALRRD
jgi:hypothetical protein